MAALLAASRFFGCLLVIFQVCQLLFLPAGAERPEEEATPSKAIREGAEPTVAPLRDGRDCPGKTWEQAAASALSFSAPAALPVVAPMMLQLRRKQSLHSGILVAEDDGEGTNESESSRAQKDAAAATPVGTMAKRSPHEEHLLSQQSRAGAGANVSVRALRGGGSAAQRSAEGTAAQGSSDTSGDGRMPYSLSQISSITTSHSHGHHRSFLQGLRGHVVVQVALFVLAATGLVISLNELLLRSRADGDGPYEEVAKLPLTTADDLRSVFEIPAEKALPDAKHRTPWRPGRLVRLRGRVVPRGGSFTAPFSARPTTVYSASVSRPSSGSSGRRQGVVQPPPLAYHAAGMDFAIKLEDECEEGFFVNVAYQNVSLFSMQDGEYRCSETFRNCTADWQGFVLAHLVVPGAVMGNPATTFSRCPDLGLSGEALDFSECALTVGAEVTCVGSIARERDGSLTLYPWQESTTAKARVGDRLASMELEDESSSAPSRRADAPKKCSTMPKGLVGNVLVSDDAALYEGTWGSPEKMFSVFEEKSSQPFLETEASDSYAVESPAALFGVAAAASHAAGSLLQRLRAIVGPCSTAA
eukprot:TRINITY_DN83436_c0_g1_i1.p1 TRINITY_DN83436_c0_g1~~TRINITY_DN83436_c0_g1_i1.p1  ORF type:complete len:587 (+),score=126.32 TRINITY_DN83436_c0_g1_i1:153-1913(+)